MVVQEIYNEQLRDLLVPPGDEEPPKLEILTSPSCGVFIRGIKALRVPAFGHTGRLGARWSVWTFPQDMDTRRLLSRDVGGRKIFYQGNLDT